MRQEKHVLTRARRGVVFSAIQADGQAQGYFGAGDVCLGIYLSCRLIVRYEDASLRQNALISPS